MLIIDTTLFAVDVFTDVANGVNLALGPENMTLPANVSAPLHLKGKLAKPHPIWGTTMILIPFLPMLAHGLHYAAMGFNPWRWLYTCGGNSMFTADKAIQFRVLYLLLAVPFTIVATPWYVCYVILTGCHSILWPEKAHPILKHKKALRLKFQEVVLESSLQLCVGKL